jgi:hypothetical protein
MSDLYKTYENDNIVQMAASLYPKSASLWLQYCCKYLDFSVFGSILSKDNLGTWVFTVKSMQEKALDRARGLFKGVERRAKLSKIKSEELLRAVNYPRIRESKLKLKENYLRGVKDASEGEHDLTVLMDDIKGILNHRPESVVKYLNDTDKSRYNNYFKYKAYNCIKPLSEISRICDEKIGCKTLKGVGRYKYQNLIGLLDRCYSIPIKPKTGLIYGKELKDVGLSVHIETPVFHFYRDTEAMKEIDVCKVEFIENPGYKELSVIISELYAATNDYDEQKIQSYKDILNKTPRQIPVKKMVKESVPSDVDTIFHGVEMSVESRHKLEVNERKIDASIMCMKPLLEKKKICVESMRSKNILNKEIAKEAGKVVMKDLRKHEAILAEAKEEHDPWKMEKRKREKQDIKDKIGLRIENNRYLELEVEEVEFLQKKHSELKDETIILTEERNEIRTVVNNRARKLGFVVDANKEAREERKKMIKEKNEFRKMRERTLDEKYIPLSEDNPPIESEEEWRKMFNITGTSEPFDFNTPELQAAAAAYRKKRPASGLGYVFYHYELKDYIHYSISHKYSYKRYVLKCTEEGRLFPFKEIIDDTPIEKGAYPDAEEEGKIKSLDSRIEDLSRELSNLNERIKSKHEDMKKKSGLVIKYKKGPYEPEDFSFDASEPWLPTFTENTLKVRRSKVQACIDAQKILESIKKLKIIDMPEFKSKIKLHEFVDNMSFADRKETFKTFAPASYESTKFDSRADFAALFMIIRVEGKSKRWDMKWRDYVYDVKTFRSCHYRAFRAAVIHELGGKVSNFSTYLQEQFQRVPGAMRVKKGKKKYQVVYMSEMDDDDIRKDYQGVSRGIETEVRLAEPLTGNFDKEYKERINKKVRLFNAMAMALGKYRYKQDSVMRLPDRARDFSLEMLEI